MTCREMKEKALQEGQEAEAPTTVLDSDSHSDPESEAEEDEHLPSPLDGALSAELATTHAEQTCRRAVILCLDRYRGDAKIGHKCVYQCA